MIRLGSILLLILAINIPLFSQKGRALRAEAGVKLKVSYLSLSDLNSELTAQGFLPFDNVTDEVEFLFNVKHAKVPFHVLFGSSLGGSETRDQTSFTVLRSNSSSIGLLTDLIFHRVSIRPLVVYQTVRLAGEIYTAATGVSALTTLSGSKIHYFSDGLRGGLQALIYVGSSYKFLIGAEGCYYYLFDEREWQFYPYGINANLPAPAQGEPSFGLVFMYRL
ncbi:MAG: hypothetical protein JNJ65_03765 [Cyclobacteriaceae bacterium]|nr:hypothetical protein [Cyclobacteriaceae bacterium]